MGSNYGWSSTRDLGKNQLGAMIFGTTKMTMNECLTKQLFGLPSQHFMYVKKVNPGLPLFLFNYTDRTLCGIFEAASSGQWNIDPYAWTSDGSRRTPYPAQVQVRVRMQCQGLTENQFKPIISDNYYTQNLFWFELDHAQTSRLLLLLSSQAFSAPRTTLTPHSTTTWMASQNGRVYNRSLEVVSGRSSHLNGVKSLPSHAKHVKTFDGISEKEVICMKLKELELKRKLLGSHCNSRENNTPVVNDVPRKLMGPPSADREDEYVVINGSSSEAISSENSFVMAQLIEKVEDLMASKTVQNDKIIALERKIVSMEQNLAEAETEIKNLNGHSTRLESLVAPREKFDDPMFLVGGYDGIKWLSSLDCYSPSQSLVKSLKPMNTERSDAAVSKLDGELFVFGGGIGSQWFDTVESYDPVVNQWTICPPLNQKKGGLAGATLNDKIYAIGGGNGAECFSVVEMLDFDAGAWIPTRSMLQKRFALAAVELNGAIYAVGGYDGTDYLRTAERFDPREHSWIKIESMNTTRGCHSLVILNEKLFVLGGYDGTSVVPTVEIYDPRRGLWMIGDPMNFPRGSAAAAVTKECIYVFGGLKSGKEMNDSIECYKEGRGWVMTKTSYAC